MSKLMIFTRGKERTSREGAASRGGAAGKSKEGEGKVQDDLKC